MVFAMVNKVSTLALLAAFSCRGSSEPAGSPTVTTSAPVAMTVTLLPPSATILQGDSLQFNVEVRDQYNALMTTQVTWSLAAGAQYLAVTPAGMVKASQPGVSVVQAAVGQLNAHAAVTISDSTGTAPPPPPPPPPPPTPTSGPAEAATLPQLWVDSRYVPPTGMTTHVPAGGNLQAAINSAARGDVITLAPGATYAGPITLPAKAGTGWITIRSAASDASLPREGERVTPAHAAQMPRIVASTNNGIAIQTVAGAAHYRLMFLEVTTAANVTQTNYLIGLGDPSANQASNMPSHFIVDRSYVHGTPSLELRRCILLSSAWTAVVDSYVSDCHSQGFDAQAILGWNGSGPYKINNNYLEGSGENVMWGGAAPATPNLIPSDIEMRGNHFRKPDSWVTEKWSIKNLFEVKFGRRILAEGNIFEGNWRQAQVGYAINLKSSGDFPWAVTEHITLRNNIIRNTGAGISLLAYEGKTTLPANHITIEHNVIERVNTGLYQGAAGYFLILDDLRDVIISHNTGISQSSINHLISYDGKRPLQRFTFSHNIFQRGTYGIKMSGGAEGTSSLDTFAPSREFSGNVLIGATNRPYPATTRIASNLAAVGFADVNGSDYALTSSSPYRGIAPGPKDPGADMAAIRTATARVVVP